MLLVRALYRPFLAVWDDDLLRDLVVAGRDVVVPRAIVERADHRGMRAAGDAGDTSLGAAIVSHRPDLDQHAIAVHGRADGGRGDVDVAGDLLFHVGALGDDKAVAVAVHRQPSRDQVPPGGGARQGVDAALDLDQLAAV